MLGNPTNLADPLGLWPSVGAIYHQGAINRNIPIPRRYQEVINRGQEHADSSQYQDGASSYRHAMRNKGQSKCDAINAADEFVRDQFRKSWRLRRAGNIENSLFEFSVGLHTLQDNTSPAHSSFRPWGDDVGAASVIGHIYRETIYYSPSDMRALNDITAQAWDWYKNGGLPKQFFSDKECECDS